MELSAARVSVSMSVSVMCGVAQPRQPGQAVMRCVCILWQTKYGW